MADESKQDKKASLQSRARRTTKSIMADKSNQDKKTSWQTKAIRTKNHHGRQEQAVQKSIMADKSKKYKPCYLNGFPVLVRSGSIGV